MAAIEINVDDPAHAGDFVRLNEAWIAEHFSLEESDRRIAADPMKIVADGGHIISLVEGGTVVGVCALFKDGDDRFQLARMAVDPACRGRGLGDALLQVALARARQRGASSVFLMSNTKLAPAIALYRKHGFTTVSEGPHPAYARCNIVMECLP